MTKTKKRWLLAGACVGILAAFAAGGWYVWYTLTTRPAVRALPSSASDLHEFYRDSGFPLYDYEYKMKARMPLEEFSTYVARLGLSPSVRGPGGPVPDWTSGDPDWWNPTFSPVRTYYHVEEDSGEMAKWEKGWVYVYAWSF